MPARSPSQMSETWMARSCAWAASPKSGCSGSGTGGSVTPRRIIALVEAAHGGRGHAATGWEAATGEATTALHGGDLPARLRQHRALADRHAGTGRRGAARLRLLGRLRAPEVGARLPWRWNARLAIGEDRGGRRFARGLGHHVSRRRDWAAG